MTTYTGTAGADTYTGTADPDTINGKEGNDTLSGGAGGDTILGELGDDTLNGDDGNDNLNGGAGSDILNGGAGDDYLEGGVGDDLDGGIGIDTFKLDIRALTAASNVNLSLLQTSIVQFGSSTSLTGVEIGEILFGSGNDTIILGANAIKAYAGDGDDHITGTTLNDETWGEAGNDTILGLAGNDILWGGDGNNALDGGDGNDQLNSGVGIDTLTGGLGDDILKAGESADTLTGGDGSDVLEGGLGADTMTGGAGIDRYVFGFGIPRSESSPSTVDVITDFEGAGVAGGDIIDLPSLSSGKPLVFNIASQAFVLGATGVQLPAEFVNDGLVDVVWQYNAAQNRVEIWADANDDGQMSEVDMVIYLNGVTSLIQSDLADNFLVWRGTGGNDNYLGNAGDNIAYGIIGDDTLDGAGGNDTLYGASGNDTLKGNVGADILQGGSDNDLLQGGDDGDQLYGQTGDDTLEGGFGDDTLRGNEGNDTLHGGFGNDSLTEGYYDAGGGDNYFYGEDGNDHVVVYGAALTANNELDGGAGNDTVEGIGGSGTAKGGAGADTLRGAGTWALDGGADNDTLYFGNTYYAGNDGVQTATGGTGADLFYLYSASNGTERDIITDFNFAEGDRLQLDSVGSGRSSGNGWWPLGNASLIFRGAMSPAKMTLGAALPGTDLGTGFLQAWTTQTAGKTYLVIDSDGDLVFDDTDFVVEFTGPVALDASSFVAGTFTAIAGTTGHDTMVGTSAVDTLYGVAGNDTIDGGDNDDFLYGGLGNDLVRGNNGHDQLFGDAGTDTLEGEAGNDTLRGGADSDILRGGSESDTLYGEAGNDILEGESASDVLVGGEGDDILRGGVGDDSMNGETGIDTADYSSSVGGGVTVNLSLTWQWQNTGNAGSDYLADIENVIGTNFDDVLTGTTLNNVMEGGAGNDSLQAGEGIDTASYASAGSGVTVSLGNGGAQNTGGAGTDTIGGFENLIGSAYNDSLTGDGGDNVITGGAGDDVMNAGTGTDTADYRSAAAGVVVSLALATVQNTGGAGFDTLSGFENLTGSDFNDRLTGSTLANLLLGGAGADILDGGAGADQMKGGLGNDTYYVDNAGDLLSEADGSGLDTVRSTVTHALGQDLENLILIGGAAIGATGNALANTITGNAAANRIDGGEGNDRLTGGAGNDVYVVDSAGDIVTELAGQGTDTVETFLTMVLGANVENLTLAGDLAINGTGNDLANVMTGNAAANILNANGGNDTVDGGLGADTLRGGAGNDVYVVDNAGDKAIETLDAGLDTVRSSVSYAIGVNVENLVLTDGAVNGTGNSLANDITGNASANLLNGGTGADTLRGGAGDDIYYVDNAGDQAVEAANAGIDTVRSSVNHVLALNVEKLILTGTAVRGTGNNLANSLVGNAAANILDGGTGADAMNGGAGNDTYYVDNVGDRAIEAAGADIDIVRSSVNFTLGANVETLILTGAALRGTGNTSANTLTGNGLANILNGGAGADTMNGGAGNDTYYVDDAGDKAVEAANAGTDIVRSSVSFTLGVNVETLILTGSALDGAGNSLANTITGTTAANSLSGAAGDDMLNAGNGNDELRGGTGLDRLSGGAGADIFHFDTALSATLNVDEILDFSVAADTIGLDRTVFSGIGANGTLAASAFCAGTAAQDAADRIIYDAATGNLYYDADGTGAAAATLFATVAPGLALTNADFLAYA